MHNHIKSRKLKGSVSDCSCVGASRSWISCKSTVERKYFDRLAGSPAGSTGHGYWDCLPEAIQGEIKEEGDL